MVDRSRPTPPVHLSELLGMLSLSADIGLGQPMEHVARSCLLAVRLAQRLGCDADTVGTVYDVALLAWVGCTADSHETAALFGDDVALRAGVYDVEMGSPAMLRYLVGRAGAGGSMAHRVRVAGGLVADGGRTVRQALAAHCQVTGRLAVRLGLGARVADCLARTFTRWDGRGVPRGTGGTDVDVVTRLVQLVDVAEVHHRRGGAEGALAALRRRRGSVLDPDLVDEFARCGPAVLDALPAESSWDELVAADPSPRPLHDDDLDAALEAVADFADLKSPWFAGHSRGVADLAAAAGRRAGLPADEVRTLRRAGLVHDLGRSGVPNTIWDKPGPLTSAERDRMELHAYYTDRILRRVPALAAAREVALPVHERLDGAGYHRGLAAGAIGPGARLLAAADCFHAMLETRPHRAARTPVAAAAGLRAEVRAGHLDADAVEAVLGAAGQPSRRAAGRPGGGPAGLTPRETEVLVLLARAASTRRIARELGITPKTAGNHIERIYLKIGANTRAAAALFAMQHGLLRTLDAVGP